MRAFLSLALLALAFPSAAQTTFGVKLGVNAATVSSSDDGQLVGIRDSGVDGVDVDKKGRLGFIGGLTADVPLSPALSFRPEVLYTQKGYAVRTQIDGVLLAGPDFDGTVTFRIDYVEVPLMLAYRFPLQSALGVAVEAGPTLAYKLNVGTGCSGNYLCDNGGLNDDDDGVRDFDLGGALGVTAGSGPFGVGLRYTNSVLSIATDESTNGGDFSVRNRVFTATGHYRFGARPTSPIPARPRPTRVGGGRSTFGLRAGLNVASVTNVGVGGNLDSRPRLGFVGGAFAEFPVSPAFALRPEVLFSQKGESSSASRGGLALTLFQDYVEVPLLGRFGVAPTPTLEVGFLAGPYLGLKLNEGLKSDRGRSDTDRIETLDYGVVLGGEVGTGPFFVDLRYSLGLAGVFDGSGGQDGAPHNSVFSVAGTYKFGR